MKRTESCEAVNGQRLFLTEGVEICLVSDVSGSRRMLLDRVDQDFVLYLYCVRGRAEIAVAHGDVLSVSAEEIFVLFPGRTVSVRLGRESGRLMALGLRGPKAVSASLALGYWDLFRTREAFRGDFFSQLVREHHASERGGRDPRIIEMVEHFLDSVWHSVRSRSNRWQFLEAVRRIAAMDIARLTTASIARELGFSRTTLNELFVNTVGRRPGDCLTCAKMAEARALLYWTNLTMKEISSIVGYANPPAFTNAFRQQFGVTPTAFRKRPFGGRTKS